MRGKRNISAAAVVVIMTIPVVAATRGQVLDLKEDGFGKGLTGGGKSLKGTG